MFTEDQIETIVTAELDSLLWSEGEEYNEAGEFTGNMWDEMYSKDDATPELRAMLTEELSYLASGEITLDQWEALKSYREHFGTGWPSHFGHDLALTRNCHGAGYWDRGLGEAGRVLTEWAESLGTLHVFHGSDSIHPEWAGMFHAE